MIPSFLYIVPRLSVEDKNVCKGARTVHESKIHVTEYIDPRENSKTWRDLEKNLKAYAGNKACVID